MTQQAINKRYYKRIGYCPKCNGKNKLLEGENCCPDCASKQYAYSLKRDRNHYNEVHKEWSRKAYQKAKEEGICVRCLKRKADYGARCSICAMKMAESRRIRKHKESRFERGLCRWCDNPVEEGYKVCEYHHQVQIERAKRSKNG